MHRVLVAIALVAGLLLCVRLQAGGPSIVFTQAKTDSWAIPVAPPVDEIGWNLPIDEPTSTATWAIPIDTADALASSIAMVHWSIPLTLEKICDCDDCKCDDCKCGMRPIKPAPSVTTVDSLLGQRLEYRKALDVARSLKCQLVAVRGLDAAETERWAGVARQRKALFAVADKSVKFDADGAYVIRWSDADRAMVIAEEHAAQPTATVQVYSQPLRFGTCANGQCGR